VVLAELAQRAVNEVQVEAGPTLSGAFLHAGLVDEVLLYLDFSVLGDTAVPLFGLPPLRALADRTRFRLVDERRVGESLRLLLRPA
jgi:diaminohydroxyphosphoribosylaminopyrimidine deaminase/5-amino-6-(5-phosphoribosylamino)uracil reductase